MHPCNFSSWAPQQWVQVSCSRCHTSLASVQSQNQGYSHPGWYCLLQAHEGGLGCLSCALPFWAKPTGFDLPAPNPPTLHSCFPKPLAPWVWEQAKYRLLDSGYSLISGPQVNLDFSNRFSLSVLLGYSPLYQVEWCNGISSYCWLGWRAHSTKQSLTYWSFFVVVVIPSISALIPVPGPPPEFKFLCLSFFSRLLNFSSVLPTSVCRSWTDFPYFICLSPLWSNWSFSKIDFFFNFLFNISTTGELRACVHVFFVCVSTL